MEYFSYLTNLALIRLKMTDYCFSSIICFKITVNRIQVVLQAPPPPPHTHTFLSNCFIKFLGREFFGGHLVTVALTSIALRNPRLGPNDMT